MDNFKVNLENKKKKSSKKNIKKKKNSKGNVKNKEITQIMQITNDYYIHTPNINFLRYDETIKLCPI